MKEPGTKHSFMKGTNLDLSYTKYPYLQALCDDNSRVKTDSTTTKTSVYSKTGIVAVPNQ